MLILDILELIDGIRERSSELADRAERQKDDDYQLTEDAVKKLFLVYTQLTVLSERVGVYQKDKIIRPWVDMYRFKKEKV